MQTIEKNTYGIERCFTIIFPPHNRCYSCFENQFRSLYSLGEIPTLVLNNRVKCCGYLKPRL